MKKLVKKDVPLLLLFMICCLSISAQSKKVAGFYPDYGSKTLSALPYSKLTDVFYAFVFPNASGVLYSHDGNYNDVVAYNATSRVQTVMNPLKNYCKSNGVRIHMAVGGMGQSWGFSATMANATYAKKMVDTLGAMAARYDLDGINIDWEFPAAGDLTNFETFMSLLKTKLNAVEISEGRNIELSIAVGVGLFDGDGIAVNSPIFALVDYIYLMSFDAKGSCYSCDPNNHSTMTTADRTIKKWSTGLVNPGPAYGGDFTSKNAPIGKLVLAMPFYSRDNSTIVSDYNVFSTSNPSGYYNDADGILGGKNYNSCPMITDKTNLIMSTYSGAGIWCWDLNADRTDQYSLLTCMSTAMAAYQCVATVPTLGADQTICGGTALLNSNIASGAGISYAWFRNNEAISGATSSTYTAAVTGNYKVIVTNNGCSKLDSALVTVNSNLQTMSDTVCAVGDSAKLKVLSPGGPFSWYAASTGGNALYVGQNYSVKVNATTNYFVDGTSSTLQHIGPKVPLNDPKTATLGWYIDYATTKSPDSLRLDVDVNVTIDSIDVYSDYAAVDKTLVFSVFNSAKVLVGKKTYTIPAGTQYTLRIPIGIALTAGTGYKLTLAGSNHKFWYDGQDAPYPYVVTGLGTIKYALASWGPDGYLYPGIYNMVLSTKNGAGGCGRIAVQALVDPGTCPTSIAETSQRALQIYPNPSNGQINFSQLALQVNVYDLAGKMVLQANNVPSIFLNENFSAGLYFIKVQTAENTYQAKVMKE